MLFRSLAGSPTKSCPSFVNATTDGNAFPPIEVPSAAGIKVGFPPITTAAAELLVPRSIPIITKYMGIDPKIVWSGNDVGWIGDSKVNHLDVSKLMSLGWKPKYSIEQTIIRTLDWLSDNKWILDVRKEK